jgi:hypothetical protein
MILQMKKRQNGTILLLISDMEKLFTKKVSKEIKNKNNLKQKDILQVQNILKSIDFIKRADKAKK